MVNRDANLDHHEDARNERLTAAFINEGHAMVGVTGNVAMGGWETDESPSTELHFNGAGFSEMPRSGPERPLPPDDPAVEWLKNLNNEPSQPTEGEQ